MTALPLESMLQRELPAASGGCPRSYGRIVLACQNTVTAIALAITRDVQASEDIAQEAFKGLAAAHPAQQPFQFPAVAAPDHPQPGPRLAAGPSRPAADR